MRTVPVGVLGKVKREAQESINHAMAERDQALRLRDQMYLSQREVGYIEWLEETLIPDLLESGTTSIADDLLNCVRMLRRREKK